MKVGISTATFFQKELTENTFSVIQRCGGDVAEVFLSTYREYEESFANVLNVEKKGLEIYSIHSLNTQFEPQLFNKADRTREDAEVLFRKVCRAAQIIGAKVYTFHGQARLKRNYTIDPEYAGKVLTRLGDIANEYGITLCLENVHWATFNSPEFYKELKKYTNNIGTVLDIKQAWQSNYDWRDYLDVMGKDLKNVHVSDVIGEKIKMIGKGEFPFKELIQRLNDNGYEGPIIVEQYSNNYDSYDEVAESVKYLKNIIGG